MKMGKDVKRAADEAAGLAVGHIQPAGRVPTPCGPYSVGRKGVDDHFGVGGTVDDSSSSGWRLLAPQTVGAGREDWTAAAAVVAAAAAAAADVRWQHATPLPAGFFRARRHPAHGAGLDPPPPRSSVFVFEAAWLTRHRDGPPAQPNQPAPAPAATWKTSSRLPAKPTRPLLPPPLPPPLPQPGGRLRDCPDHAGQELRGLLCGDGEGDPRHGRLRGLHRGPRGAAGHPEEDRRRGGGGWAAGVGVMDGLPWVGWWRGCAAGLLWVGTRRGSRAGARAGRHGCQRQGPAAAPARGWLTGCQAGPARRWGGSCLHEGHVMLGASGWPLRGGQGEVGEVAR